MSNHALLKYKNQLCDKLFHTPIFKFINYCVAFSLPFLYYTDLTGLSYLNCTHLNLILLKEEISVVQLYILFEF